MRRSGSAYPDGVEILLWLLPSAVVALGAMVWVGWQGSESRGEVDRDVAVRRLAAALEKEPGARRQRQRPPRPLDRSTGIAVRPTRASSDQSRGQSGGLSGDQTRNSA